MYCLCVVEVDRLYYDMEMMFGRRPGIWWKICWCYITPLIMLVGSLFMCNQSDRDLVLGLRLRFGIGIAEQSYLV